LATDVPTRLAWTQRKRPRQAPIEGKKARVTRGGWELPSVFFLFSFFGEINFAKMRKNFNLKGIFLSQYSHFVSFFKNSLNWERKIIIKI
jgi:hypothetical protein